MRTIRGGVIWGLAFTAALQVTILSGCHSRAGLRGDPQFTPDGSRVAYVYAHEDLAGPVGMGWILGCAKETLQLRSLSVPYGESMRVVPIGERTITALTPRPPEHVLHRSPGMVISPDSQHIAYVRNEGDVLIAGRRLGPTSTLKEAARVSGVKGIAWLSPTELAYAEEWPVGDGDDEEEITIWRQTISGDQERRQVYRSTDRWHHTHWSPDGRHVLVKSPTGPLELLDVESGHVAHLDVPRRSYLREAAWSPDSRKLFLLVQDEAYGTHEPPYRLLNILVSPADGRIIATWAQIHQQIPSLPRTTGSCWTPDAMYVVLRSDEDHWILLDPETGETRDLDDPLSRHFPDRSSSKVYAVGPMPVEGWLWIHSAPSSPGERSRVFAMDYDGHRLVEIAEGTDWNVSKGGKYVADTDEDGQIRTRTLRLPSLDDCGFVADPASASETRSD